MAADTLQRPITTDDRIFDARATDFETWRRIKRAVPDATIKDVGLSVIGGALRRYLDHHGELPERSLYASYRCPSGRKGPGATDGNDVGPTSPSTAIA